MKKIISLLLIGLAVLPLGAATRAELHEGLRYKKRTEKLAEVSKFYGVSTELAKKFFRNVPDSFDTVSDGLRLAKIADMLLNANDTEALAEILIWDVERIAQKLIEKNLPGLMTFYNAVGLYKDSLEIMRDYVYIPMMEERIYQAYKGQRMKESHVSDHESISFAFDLATMGPFSGYYVVRDTMLQKMARQMGYNQEIMGPKFLSRIDDFWMKRMEAKFQQELARSKMPAIPGLVLDRGQASAAVSRIQEYFTTSAYKRLSAEEKQQVQALARKVVADLGGSLDVPADVPDTNSDQQKPDNKADKQPADPLAAERARITGHWSMPTGGRTAYIHFQEDGGLLMYILDNGEQVARGKGSWSLPSAGRITMNMEGDGDTMKYLFRGENLIIEYQEKGETKQDTLTRVKGK